MSDQAATTRPAARARRAERRARLAMSLIAEPGDPRIAAQLSERSTNDLLSAVVAGADDLPESWRSRAVGLEGRIGGILTSARGRGIRWVCPGDAEWPAQLDDLDQIDGLAGVGGRPLGLWVRGAGRLDGLAEQAAAVVGARDATTYGCDVAGDLAADLVDAGTTVVSGAAYGIDAAAHRGALSVDGPTVAVLACGADVDYPRAHAGLLRRIAEAGAVVSEHPPGSTPTKGRFLTRNRVIAALAQGTVVVEAARRSGALNTLGWTNELGRIALAVPGPVTSQASVGVHHALRTGRATLVSNGAEALEDLDALGRRDATPPPAPQTAWDVLPSVAREVLEALPGRGTTTVDVLAWRVGAPLELVASSLGRLESQGFVRQVDDGWSLARRADLEPAPPTEGGR
ncbi:MULTISPECIES: DNA-processing protein DprA [Mumia]|uniref:DNA-processing protein DprA n=1 Tax=Mumia TaxID=1546255 RepID=UPI001AB052FB|nr:DNA-processing protein DprA [Mumia sp. ZJ1417]